ncbi:uncharacterized protein LOC130800147 isoform X1 [Amaranthus tricolor]|uniref:uncharacterized protein LOC130800147 isoform X1 n=1 Tax=Amaranthus tricolor TaxID=29722 RepID=UPI00258F82A9|nr:uncharacterized protein LOC130800147 isoform X1 [Amaranthus tricolor]XP_057519496.1 uncharacterized protein LOC130800147 isoform X1 [Amaranthus tricolor]
MEGKGNSQDYLNGGFHKFDGEEGEEGLSPISSQYSSCDGESEFDRYCSANSVMGTPSVCSFMGVFHDSLDSDFGSLKSLEGFKLGGGRLHGKLEGKSHSLLGRDHGLGNSSINSEFCELEDEEEGLSCVGGLLEGLEGFMLDGVALPRKFEGNGDLVSAREHSLGNSSINDAIRESKNEEEGLSCVGGSSERFEGFMLDGVAIPRKFEGNADSMFGREHGLSNSLDDDAFCESKNEGKMGIKDNAGSSSSSRREMEVLGSKAEAKRVKLFDGDVGRKEDLAVLLKNVENALLQGAVAARSVAENLLEHDQADEMDDERCREVDKTSSRYDHSEGEDSMFNYGSDDGSNPSAYYVRNAGDHHGEDAKSGNLMLMNPSVAFGSNDLEDFELDGMGDTKQLPDNFWTRQKSGSENEIDSQDLTLMRPTLSKDCLWHEKESNERDVCSDNDDVPECSLGSAMNPCTPKFVESGAPEGTGDISVRCKYPISNDDMDKYLDNCSLYNEFQKYQCPSIHVVSEIVSTTCEKERTKLDMTSDTISGDNDLPVAQQYPNPLPDIEAGGEASFRANDAHGNLELDLLQGPQVECFEGYLLNSTSTRLESEEGRIYTDINLCGSQCTSRKDRDLELNDIYDELVHEMEEILLESRDSPLTRLTQRTIEFQSEQSSSLNGGNSSARTSGFEDDNPLIHHALRIDGVEVVGAKQRKGDISLSERLVGIKEYTTYIIRVWSGKNRWEVERRYRDFYALYHQLKTSFAAREWILPFVWSNVDKESRKFFGNTSPNVVAERSSLIQECLSSILQSKYYCSPPSALIWFLSPPEALLNSAQSNDVMRQPNVGARTERVPSLGKKISLIVDIRPHKSVNELLDAQHYSCAGCHTHFDNGKTRILEILQTFVWGKPRFCEYTGQLFCSSCHTNENAVLPARVLHNWDFTPYPVSQMAKSYLDSIVDKPMLCVSAANPFLLSRVSVLRHVVGVRRKLGAMLPYITCSFRRSIYKRLGHRKYLLETTDFFALRDLFDLSKGAFAGLPTILEAVLKKIEEHITELCLECCDHGVPCGARQACDNPSSLIFPFQEEVIQRCNSCTSVFHKHCFNKLVECRCGAILNRVDENHSTANPRHVKAGSAVGSSSLLVKKSDSKLPVTIPFQSVLFFGAGERKQRKR